MANPKTYMLVSALIKFSRKIRKTASVSSGGVKPAAR